MRLEAAVRGWRLSQKHGIGGRGAIVAADAARYERLWAEVSCWVAAVVGNNFRHCMSTAVGFLGRREKRREASLRSGKESRA